MHTPFKIGIDAGGTLIKLAIQTASQPVFRIFSSNDPISCARWLETHYDGAEFCLTGGGAQKLAESLESVDWTHIPEFDASLQGAEWLLSKGDNPVPTNYILANVGTGTSLHVVRNKDAARIGGSGVGGGTLMGLSGIMLGINDFEQFIQLSATGRRDNIDVTVAQLYAGAEPPIPGDLTASNFGRVQESLKYSPADQAAAVVGLVAETVSTLAILAAQKESLQDIVYIGSTFVANPLMVKIVDSYSQFCGMHPYILPHGSYCGAIGAMLSL
ncbi:type II pantothenate kinase [Sporolactobacillus spathodeae]|uniref:Type II pantothenate kinase n=1 Tax=Sporolactobacillus spathodeae TaxID=1465502 RepID=A0ABS2Q892_9BACL|nr:type II pantothenate kinase [Sporolactobacillus spathodeae]MBM7658004.1 type II pantothenate kinase [Sporolactobacillus spathodeae]